MESRASKMEREPFQRQKSGRLGGWNSERGTEQVCRAGDVALDGPGLRQVPVMSVFRAHGVHMPWGCPGPS